MIAKYTWKNEPQTVWVDDDLEDAAEVVRQLRSSIVEQAPELNDWPHFVSWLCEGVLNSLASDRSEIELGVLTVS